ncbi:hypothetical protein EON79_22745, partial [bacterium]
MVHLKAELFRDLETVEGLHRALQNAIELEHATLPVYLYTHYSLDPIKNRRIRSLIMSVAMEEMLHFGLACNLLNAVGGAPRIDHPGFVPTFPGPLPGAVQDGLVARLAPFSKELVRDVFMEIEEPETPMSFPVVELSGVPPP